MKVWRRFVLLAAGAILNYLTSSAGRSKFIATGFANPD